MVFVRYCVITAVWVFCMLGTTAQTVYYPDPASDLLKATANDIAVLLQKAVKGSSFGVQPYEFTAGIVDFELPKVSHPRRPASNPNF